LGLGVVGCRGCSMVGGCGGGGEEGNFSFFFYHCVQTSPGSHQTFYPISICGSFAKIKTAIA
jgi:hypothetical protein